MERAVMTPIIDETVMTCPACGHSETERMSENA